MSELNLNIGNLRDNALLNTVQGTDQTAQAQTDAAKGPLLSGQSLSITRAGLGDLTRLLMTFQMETAEKLKRYETENSRLRSASANGALVSAQMQQLRDELVQREKEIVELRQNVAKAERARAVMEQTMQARINTMESAPLLPNIETTQAREARHVKLASWMRFSK